MSKAHIQYPPYIEPYWDTRYNKVTFVCKEGHFFDLVPNDYSQDDIDDVERRALIAFDKLRERTK